jgi:tetratricopeptide (TPR) repeat protein
MFVYISQLILSNQDYSSWTLPIAASYYWRATGDSKKALNCIWQSIENVPPDMEDILFVNLASLLSSQNYLHSALQIAHIALSINQHFIVNHYMLANLYAVMVNLSCAYFDMLSQV